MSRYQNQPLRFGLQGLVLKRARDLVDPTQATILSNLVNAAGGKSIGRPGQTQLGISGGYSNIHSMRRLNAQQGSPLFARFYGGEGSLQIGTTGNPTQIQLGFSGNPLTMVADRSEIAGDAWMYVADSAQMVKARIDGTVMPIGLPAPSGVPTSALAAQLSTTIDAMNSASGWAGHHDAVSAAPTVNTSAPSPPTGGSATTLVTNAGAFKVPYTSWMDKAISADLTSVGGTPASNEDYLHLWIFVDFPQDINEVRVYFVTSAFTAGILPGTSSTQNVSGYWKSFTPDAFAAAIAGAPIGPSALSAAELAAIYAGLNRRGQVVGTAVPIAGGGLTGAGAWTEYGAVGRPLYRGDFGPFGNTVPITATAPNGSWGSVTGVVVWVSVVGPATAGAAAPNVKVAVNNSYLFGGYGLDDGPVGDIPYNWVYTNYDPRTGAESNLVGSVSAPTPSTPDLDVLRGSVTITPSAYGNSAIRQRFYRLGGSISDNWYFTGVNSSDGGAFTDTNTDAFVLGTGLTAPIDHFQPVATVNGSGATVLGQPVPGLWGPIQGMLFACGDPYRPGWLYSSKPSEPDHWFNSVEVCAASEPLQMGCVWGDRAFVFSTEKGYQIIPNLDIGGGITTLPTACTHGLVSRWGLAVGLSGIYLCSRDGIFRTDGTSEGVPISDDIRPLFTNQPSEGATNGYYPIDFAQPAMIRLRVVGTDLWFGYQDTLGNKQWMIYSLLYAQWRSYTFTNVVSEVYQEEGVYPTSILLGERFTGVIDFHSGLTDRNSEILWHLRTAALDQGSPRVEKRYGNWAFDLDTGGGGASLQALTNNETGSYPAITIPPAPGRNRIVIDPFSGTTVRARNLSLDLQGGSVTQFPILYLGEVAYEDEPADYVLWETDEIDHGLTGWQTPLWLWLAARGATSLLLTRTVYDDRLNILLVDTYTVNVTGVKSHQYVPFAAMKGALFLYRITSADPFRIYEDESTMTIQAQGGGPPVSVRPFGTADPSAASSIVEPLLAAMRTGGQA